MVPAEFETLYREHSDAVYRSPFRILGSAEDAEDVLQTVFLRFLRRDPGQQQIDQPEYYLRRSAVNAALDRTRDFVESTYRPIARIAARNGSLKEAWDACRAECDPKFKDYAIYEHCLPFNVARAYDEARGIHHPRIWTAQRDLDMWAALQG